MGTQYLFTCRGCNYEAMVEGGLSGGMFCRTATVSCQKCQKLYDVVFAEPDAPNEPVSYDGEVPDTFKCPKRHPAELWDDPGKCPKCGDNMLKGNEIMLWD